MNYKKSFWLVCVPEKDLQPHSPHLQSWELGNSWLRNWNTLSSHGSCFLWMQRASVKDWRGKVIPGDSPQHPNHAHVPSALPLNVSQVISKATILGQSTVNVLLDCSGLLSPTSVLDPPQSVLHAAAKGRLRDIWHHPTVLWVPSSAPRAAAIQSTFLMRPCPSISLPTTSFLWTHWFSAVSSDSPGSGLPQDFGTCCFLCKSCSSPSSNMTEALPPLTVCIPTLHTFCSSSHASQFNRHLSAFTMQTCGEMTWLRSSRWWQAQLRNAGIPTVPRVQACSHWTTPPDHIWPPCQSFDLVLHYAERGLQACYCHSNNTDIPHLCVITSLSHSRHESQDSCPSHPCYLHNPGHCVEQQGWKMGFSRLLPIKPARTQWTPLYTEN